MYPKNLSFIERQILANQHRILSFLDPDSGHEISAEILESGYTGAYPDALTVHSEETPYEVCTETTDILLMYRRINNVVGQMDAQTKEDLDLDKIAFEGFDGNNDDHYHYMKLLVEDLGKWEEYRGMKLNSHTQSSLRKYKKLLDYQNGVLKEKRYDLNEDDIRQMIELV